MESGVDARDDLHTATCGCEHCVQNVTGGHQSRQDVALVGRGYAFSRSEWGKLNRGDTHVDLKKVLSREAKFESESQESGEKMEMETEETETETKTGSGGGLTKSFIEECDVERAIFQAVKEDEDRQARNAFNGCSVCQENGRFQYSSYTTQRRRIACCGGPGTDKFANTPTACLRRKAYLERKTATCCYCVEKAVMYWVNCGTCHAPRECRSTKLKRHAMGENVVFNKNPENMLEDDYPPEKWYQVLTTSKTISPQWKAVCQCDPGCYANNKHAHVRNSDGANSCKLCSKLFDPIGPYSFRFYFVCLFPGCHGIRTSRTGTGWNSYGDDTYCATCLCLPESEREKFAYHIKVLQELANQEKDEALDSAIECWQQLVAQNYASNKCYCDGTLFKDHPEEARVLFRASKSALAIEPASNRSSASSSSASNSVISTATRLFKHGSRRLYMGASRKYSKLHKAFYPGKRCKANDACQLYKDPNVCGLKVSERSQWGIK